MSGVLRRFGLGALMGLILASAPAHAQSIKTIDPDTAIDADLSSGSDAAQAGPPPVQGGDAPPPVQGDAAPPPGQGAPSPARQGLAAPDTGTYHRDDLIGAAEGVFGKGAAGLADIIEKILKDQGEPNAYIAGREAGGAVVVGLRYGSGIMNHKVEGQRPVYWTGPSVGFDVGGDANKVFVLVYNLYDSQELYKRYPAAEGRVYFVGGFSATYLRRGDVVLIPVRLGVGWRLGANVGYMKFSEHQRWVPF